MVAITTLALVMGAGGAVLAVVNATLVRPLPFPEPERLARIYTLPPGETDIALRTPLHPLEYVRLRQQLRLADAVVGAAPAHEWRAMIGPSMRAVGIGLLVGGAAAAGAAAMLSSWLPGTDGGALLGTLAAAILALAALVAAAIPARRVAGMDPTVALRA